MPVPRSCSTRQVPRWTRSQPICSRSRRAVTACWSSHRRGRTNAPSAGAPETARTYLKRALASRPPNPSGPPSCVCWAPRSLHRPEAAEHLMAALDLTDDVGERAELTRELAVPLIHSGHIHEAVSVLERSSTTWRAPTARLARARGRHGQRRAASPRVAARRSGTRTCLVRRRTPGRTFAERIALAAVAGEGDAAAPTAEDAVACAQSALGDGRLSAREAGAEPHRHRRQRPGGWGSRSSPPTRWMRDRRTRARAGSMFGSALAFCFQGLLGHRIGALPAAEADFRQAIEITPSARWAAKTYALVFLIDILLDRGRRDEAAAVLSASRMPDSAPPVLPLDAPAEPRATADRGRRDRLGSGGHARGREGFAAGSFGACLWQWRSFHALELAREGEPTQALELARRRRPSDGLRCAASVGDLAAHRRSRAGRRAGHRLAA